MENMVEWWWWRVGGGTDLDTTELHQHNDQSTQSRPKPEGSGRRRAVGYKPETKSRGSECSRWNQVWHPCALMLDGNTKKTKNKTASSYFHTSSLSDKKMNYWGGAEATDGPTQDRQRRRDLHTDRWENRRHTAMNTCNIRTEPMMLTHFIGRSCASTDGHMPAKEEHISRNMASCPSVNAIHLWRKDMTLAAFINTTLAVRCTLYFNTKQTAAFWSLKCINEIPHCCTRRQPFEKVVRNTVFVPS